MQLKYFISIIFVSTNIYLTAQNEFAVKKDSTSVDEETFILDQLNAINELWYAKKAQYHETSQPPLSCKDISTTNIDSIYYLRLKLYFLWYIIIIYAVILICIRGDIRICPCY